jgi:hypothetical protein
MQQEKEQLLAKQLKVMEVVNRALLSVMGLETQVEGLVMHEVE